VNPVALKWVLLFVLVDASTNRQNRRQSRGHSVLAITKRRFLKSSVDCWPGSGCLRFGQYVVEMPPELPGADQHQKLAIWWALYSGEPVGADPEWDAAVKTTPMKANFSGQIGKLTYLPSRSDLRQD
jgi:hypothetical protein